MGFSQAFIGLVIVIIVLAVFIPITGELLPTIIGDSGALTGFMVSSIIVVIITAAFFVFMRQSTAHGNLQEN